MRKRWLPVAAWILSAVAAFVVYLRLANTKAVNSDGSSQALQAWDILHGNVLLHGWALRDASLYTIDTAEYVLIELVRGLNAGVVQIGAAVTYTLAVLLAAALAKGTATGREAAVRVALAAGIMLAPQLDSGTNVLLSSPDHMATSVPVMLTLLILDRARPRWYVPAAVTVLLAWSVIGDQLVLVIAILPLIAVCAVRVAGSLVRRWAPWRENRQELALAAGAVVAALVGVGAPHVIRALGGYQMQPLSSSLSPLPVILGHNLPITGDGFLLLGGAYFTGLPASAQTWFVMLHVAGVALAALGVAVTAWRFFRGEALVPQLLLTGIVLNVVAYALGTHAIILPNTREMAPVLPLAAALAGRQLPGLLVGRALGMRAATAGVLGFVLGGYLAGLGLELTAPAAPPQNAQLAAWLTAHRLRIGLSGYWQGNVVTLTSGGQAAVRPVLVRNGRIVPSTGNVKSGWFEPARSSADFVVLAPPIPGYIGFTNRNAVIATFGEPARTCHIGPYTILQWHKNLLADMR
ncbi:MAG TPA: hypothetical protein VF060_13845 [Trebonia sp.]